MFNFVGAFTKMGINWLRCVFQEKVILWGGAYVFYILYGLLEMEGSITIIIINLIISKQ